VIIVSEINIGISSYFVTRFEHVKMAKKYIGIMEENDLMIPVKADRKAGLHAA